MAEIELYTTPTCPFCIRAKSLLDSKGVGYTEYDVAGQPEIRAKMTQRANGRRTVPQIFINHEHVGGSDDLQALESAGKLDAMISA